MSFTRSAWQDCKVDKDIVSTVNPLLSPPAGLFISSPFKGGGLNRDGGLFERRGLLNLETMMVSVFQKELEYKVEKLKYKKF